MSSSSHNFTNPNTVPDVPLGELTIELPHWLADVFIFNNLSHPVYGLSEIEASPSGVYETKISLPQGIYKIEVRLQNQIEKKLIDVYSDTINTISFVDSLKLQLTSIAPLPNTSNIVEPQMSQAEEWSHKSTCVHQISQQADPVQLNSQLFLFVRSFEAGKYTNFVDDLSLLDIEGQLVTDFSEKDCNKNISEGWLVFNTNLPEGYYVLRREPKPDIPSQLRFQPIYLCKNWQTQIFLSTQTQASLSRMSMSIMRFGDRFSRENTSLLASESLFNSLQPNQPYKNLITKKQILDLINEKLDNPWLGVLIAHSLLKLKETDGYETSKYKEELQKLSVILKFLSQHIPDHPDVRALLLNDKQEASKPFNYPPLLQASLERVRQHATRFTTTIPIDTLTEKVLGSTLANSAWTAWRDPAIFSNSKQYSEFVTVKDFKPSFDSYKKTLARSSPRTPIFSPNPNVIFDKVETQPVTKANNGNSLNTQIVLSLLLNIIDSPLIYTAQKLLQQELIFTSEQEIINLEIIFKQLLKNIHPTNISKFTGLPLSRIKFELRQIKIVAEQLFDSLPHYKSIINLILSNDQEDIQLRDTLVPIYLDHNFRWSNRRQNSILELEKVFLERCLSINAFFNPIQIEIFEYILNQICQNKSNFNPTIENYIYTLEIVDETLNIEPLDKIDSRLPKLKKNIQLLKELLSEQVDIILLTNSGKIPLYCNAAFVNVVSKSNSIPNLHQLTEQLSKRPTTPTLEFCSISWKQKSILITTEEKSINLAHLYILNRENVPHLSLKTIQEIKQLVPQLNLYASFIANGSKDSVPDYIRRAEDITKYILKIINKDTPLKFTYKKILQKAKKHKQKQDYPKALKYYQRALSIAEDVYKENPLQIAKSYGNIAELCITEEKYDDLLMYYHPFLSYFQKVFSNIREELPTRDKMYEKCAELVRKAKKTIHDMSSGRVPDNSHSTAKDKYIESKDNVRPKTRYYGMVFSYNQEKSHEKKEQRMETVKSSDKTNFRERIIFLPKKIFFSDFLVADTKKIVIAQELENSDLKYYYYESDVLGRLLLDFFENIYLYYPSTYPQELQN